MKLREILETLDAEGWRRLDKGIKEIYAASSLERKTWKYIYPNRGDLSLLTFLLLKSQVKHEQSNSSYRNVLHRLVKYIEQRIASDELLGTSQQVDYHLILGRYYKRRGQLALFKHHMDLRMNVINDYSAYDALRPILEIQQHFELVYSELKFGKKEESYDLLRQSVSYLSMVMNQLLEIESANKNSPYTGKVDSNVILPNQLVSLLNLAHRLIKDQDKEAFKAIQSVVWRDHIEMPRYMVQMMLIYMNNFCYAEIRAGNHEYHRDLIDNNEFGMRHQYLLSQGLLSEHRFINMVEWKSYFESEEEVLNFINTWKRQLHSDDSNSVLQLAHAFRCFGQARYGEVLVELSTIKIGKGKYRLELIKRWLLLCSLSTNSEHKYYAKELESSEKYLNRNRSKIGANLYLGSMNLVKVLRMFSRDTSSNQILKKIASMNVLVMRYWISNRMGERQALL